MIEIALLVICIVSVVGNYFSWKGLNNAAAKIETYETLYSDMNGELKHFALACERALNTPIYSNEPVIMSFVDSMKDIHNFLSTVDSEYQLDIQLTDENVAVENSHEFREQGQSAIQ